jgi:hypothetical protein
LESTPKFDEDDVEGKDLDAKSFIYDVHENGTKLVMVPEVFLMKHVTNDYASYAFRRIL